LEGVLPFTLEGLIANCGGEDQSPRRKRGIWEGKKKAISENMIPLCKVRGLERAP